MLWVLQFYILIIVQLFKTDKQIASNVTIDSFSKFDYNLCKNDFNQTIDI